MEESSRQDRIETPNTLGGMVLGHDRIRLNTVFLALERTFKDKQDIIGLGMLSMSKTIIKEFCTNIADEYNKINVLTEYEQIQKKAILEFIETRLRLQD